MSAALLTHPFRTVDWPAMSTDNSRPEFARPEDAPEHDRADIDVALGLTGTTSVEDLGPDALL